jgi:hypothetical protein
MRKNYRAVIAALGTVAALAATSGLSVLGEIHWK